MIPQIIASTGAYVNSWRRLKSMQHALHRALTVTDPSELSPLDREGLEDVAEFFRVALSDESAGQTQPAAFLSAPAQPELDYALPIELRQRTKETKAFEAWLNSQGYEKKIQRLIKTIRRYCHDWKNGLIAGRVPKDEFMVSHEILSTLLSRAESAMQE